MRRLAILLAILFAGFCGFVLFVGSRLIAPAPAPIAESALQLPHEAVEFRGASGNVLHGWFVPAASDGRGTIVLMHGVRANRLSMVGRAVMLHRAGYAVLLFDFQAHGASPGEHITMGWLESGDARAAVAYARSRAPGQFVGAVGVSLGGAAAVLGADPLPVDALVLEAVYPDIEAATANRLSIRFGGLGRLLSPLLLMQLRPRLGIGSTELMPIAAITRVRAPLFVIAGGADRHTTRADSMRLFEAAPEPKQLWMIPGAAHRRLRGVLTTGVCGACSCVLRVRGERRRG
ncbi:MAG TPA: alpha/beta hydrolase [Steroidobacteraceae bacterium]|nr:alpha/beta hydrolase [Steroidobacteraceae bacterium]